MASRKTMNSSWSNFARIWTKCNNANVTRAHAMRMYDADWLFFFSLLAISIFLFKEPYGPARAMHALGTAICSSRVEFARQFGCLQMISESEEGRQCIASHFIVDGKEEEMQNNGQLCEAVNASSQCLALRIFADCGQDAMEFVFQTTNEYLAQASSKL